MSGNPESNAKAESRLTEREVAVAIILMKEFGLVDLDHPLLPYETEEAAKRVVALLDRDAENRRAESLRTLEDLETALPDEARYLRNLLDHSDPP